MSKKRKLEECEVVPMNATTSIVIQSMPLKLKNLGSFSIPCKFGNMEFDIPLYDFGESVSLIPLSVCKRLGICELKPANVSMQPANKSVKYPIGVLKDVPIKVGHLYIPTDFIIMDIK